MARSNTEPKELPQYNVPTPTSFVTEDQVRDTISQEMNNMTGVQRVMSGQIQSANFITGSAGWQIQANGDVEFSSGTFRGTISGATIVGSTIETTVPGSSTGGAVVIGGGSNKYISLYYNTLEVGRLEGVNSDPGDGDIAWVKLSSPQSGRYITINSSMIYIDGDFKVRGGYYIKVGSTMYGGDSGTFKDADGNKIRVRGGLITNLHE